MLDLDPMTLAVTAAMAVGIPLLLLYLARRAPPTSAASAPAPAPYVEPADKKNVYKSAKELRDELDSAGLLREATKRKDNANDFLKKGMLEPAMQAYLAAIWLLKVSKPLYPEVLSGQMPPTDQEAARLLGSGRGAAPGAPRVPPGRIAALRHAATVRLDALWAYYYPPPPPDALESEAADALRAALHLNVAAVALKREDWYLAREACAFVLASQPVQPKALYRLAQARNPQPRRLPPRSAPRPAPPTRIAPAPRVRRGGEARASSRCARCRAARRRTRAWARRRRPSRRWRASSAPSRRTARRARCGSGSRSSRRARGGSSAAPPLVWSKCRPRGQRTAPSPRPLGPSQGSARSCTARSAPETLGGLSRPQELAPGRSQIEEGPCSASRHRCQGRLRRHGRAAAAAVGA